MVHSSDLVSTELLAEVASSVGSSFYLAKPEALLQNITSLLEETRKFVPNTSFGYSVKTNYLPFFIRIGAACGYAEVVSGAEYELARKSGVAGERIIFNGPSKTVAELERALLEGARVNLDNGEELILVRELCNRHADRHFSVGIRCCFPVEENTDSRFGFDIPSGDAIASVKSLERIPNMDVTGLHCHFTTQSKSPESYALRIEKMAQLWRDCQLSRPPEWIDVGGGIFGPMEPEIRAQFKISVPTFADYASSMGVAFNRNFDDRHTQLIMEPGVGVVANCMDFFARVLNLRKNGSRGVAVCSGSFQNVKPTKNTFNLSVLPYSMGSERRRFEGDIVGNTCLEYDVLRAGFTGDLAVGDFLCFRGVGAYTIVFTPRFIHPAPAIIALRNGGWEILRSPESFDRMFGDYFP
jgi:diaminopimelate decarboxylase